MVTITESTKRIEESVSKQDKNQRLKESTQDCREGQIDYQELEQTDECVTSGLLNLQRPDTGSQNSDDCPIFENDIADLGDYSSFFQGISDRPELYDFDQNHETEKIADTCVGHVLSDQSKIDDSSTDDSDSDLESDYYYPISPSSYYPISSKDSALINLDPTLTKNEKGLVDEFCKKLAGVTEKNDQDYKEGKRKDLTTSLNRVKYVIDKYLQKGIRLNLKCSDGKHTVTSLVFKEIINILDRIPQHEELSSYEDVSNELTDDKNIEITRNIMSDLLLRGGRVKRSSFYDDKLLYATYGFSYEIFAECEEIDNRLKNIAYESIVNKSEQAQKDGLKVDRDNGYFYAKYPQDSVIEVAKILNNEEVKNLNLSVSILKIGESVVRIENEEGIRNYTDLTDGSDIVLTFYTSLGEPEVRLYPDTQDTNLIRVEINSQDLLEQLKNCNEKIGKNCLLGGLPVSEAIEQGSFVRSGKSMRSEVIGQSDRKQMDSWAMREELRRISGTEREKIIMP
ncbi:MAG: hypothetical protein PG978_000540 [Wolbachia endosymbiont of Ctenocephalides felis wCfeF]|nr:MAG: hypothetical protein PG978_000540 [Wolbachia endosymbiont of Ctenocephalides felis wCfeF]